MVGLGVGGVLPGTQGEEETQTGRLINIGSLEAETETPGTKIRSHVMERVPGAPTPSSVGYKHRTPTCG